jgi:hypothetical protein
VHSRISLCYNVSDQSITTGTEVSLFARQTRLRRSLSDDHSGTRSACIPKQFSLIFYATVPNQLSITYMLSNYKITEISIKAFNNKQNVGNVSTLVPLGNMKHTQERTWPTTCFIHKTPYAGPCSAWRYSVG